MALFRTKTEDAKRRGDLSNLKEMVLKERKQLEEKSRRNQNHFKKLPVEIFGDICWISVSQDSASLIVLLHICKYWRQAAWHNPRLWGTLTLSSRRPVDKAKLWIARSNGRIRELNARFGLLSDHTFLPSEHLRGIQWEYLRVCRANNWDFHLFLQSLNMTHILANLEEQEITGQHVYGSERREFFEESNLQRLTLVKTSLSWDVLSLYAKNLRKLSAHYVLTTESPISIFQNNPRLETLIIVKNDILASFPDVALSELKHLELHSEFGSAQLLSIPMPKLELLHISRCPQSLDLPLTKMTQSGPLHLTDVSLSYCKASPSTLIELLLAAPALRSLELSRFTALADVLEALASSGTPSPSNFSKTALEVPLCPLLINIKVTHCADVTTGPLMRLIKCRLPKVDEEKDTDDDISQASSSKVPVGSVARIQSMTVDGCPRVEAECIPWFRTHVQQFSCVYLTKSLASYRR